MQQIFNYRLLLRKNTRFIIGSMDTPLGKLIKSRLKEMKKTQAWFAEQCGVSSPAVTKWIKTEKISLDKAILASKILGIQLDDFVDGKNQDEFKRQLIYFFEGMSLKHKDDLLYMAQKFHSDDRPDDRLSNPMPNSPNEKRVKQ